MKYRLVHFKENGSYDYTLHIEECVSVLSRLFFSTSPKTYVINGSKGRWEHRVIGIAVPREVCDFADEVIEEHVRDIRLRK